MSRETKKSKLVKSLVKPGSQYGLVDAVNILSQVASKKFSESVDVAINLGVDPKKPDQMVVGSCVLPNGTGKKIRVAAFAQGAKLEEAKQAGADVYGFEDLAEAIQKGRLDFDVVVATPDAMRVLGKLGQILGPRGLMPNPKVGTVTLDIAQAVKNAKSGQIRFRTDKKNGIVHCPVGRVDFDADKIRENLAFLLNEIRRLKPSSSKGIYLKSVVLSSTMGPGLLLDLSSLSV